MWDERHAQAKSGQRSAGYHSRGKRKEDERATSRGCHQGQQKLGGKKNVTGGGGRLCGLLLV